MSPNSSDNEEAGGEILGELTTSSPREEAEEDVNAEGEEGEEEGGRVRRRRRSSSGDFRKMWMEGPATEDPLLSKRPCVTCRKSKVRLATEGTQGLSRSTFFDPLLFCYVLFSPPGAV